ncbi:MAG TPA: hypothetical protein VEP91_11800 [Solirubrobacterales bacterium]|nr:hypothetical protein [Solirubrobacterales bacterium]
MEAMRSTWTDSRLDDLNKRVGEIANRLDSLGSRIDSLQHTILLVGGGMFAAFVAVLAAIIGLIATQI